MSNRLVEKIERHNASKKEVAADRALARARADAQAWKAKYQEALKQLDAAEKRCDFVSQVSDEREWEEWEREIKKGKSDASAIVLASDWHVGETVDSKTVHGLNEYSPAIAEKRIKRFFQKIPEYIERYVPMSRELVLWAGGDFITGYIHEELAENNSLSPAEECLFFREHWNAGLGFLLREIQGRITVVTSYGNHGRTTQKIRVQTGAHNSFEWLTYNVMANDWRQEPRVKWKISESYHNWHTIHGREVRFHHGDAIRFQGGVGGIAIPTRKAISQWNKSRHADLDCIGDKHTYVDDWSWVGNGSLIGYGAYSLRIKADYQPPVQAFLVFDRSRGLRQSTRIFPADA